MPLPWFPPYIPELHAAMQKPVPVYQVDEELVVEYKSYEFDAEANVITFKDDVKATYGPTVVTADQLDINLNEKVGEAKGNVQLTDPEGTLTANNITFSWSEGNRSGSAKDVSLETYGVRLSAEEIVIGEESWVLTNVRGTTCRQNPPLYQVRSPKVVLRTGKGGSIQKPKLYVRGMAVGTFPTSRFSLDRRSKGIRIPSLGFDPDKGLGISWSSGYLLDDQTNISADFSSFPQTFPSYKLEVTRSWVPPSEAHNEIAPKSELGERFVFGYFDSVRVTSADTENRSLRSKRNSVSISSSWNQGSSARRLDEEFSKPLEVTYDRSDEFGDFGFAGQLRLQSIQEVGSDSQIRGYGQLSVGAPPIGLARNLSAHIRVDTTAIAGEKFYGWARGQVGVVYQPIPQVAIGAAYFNSTETGSPMFSVDELYSKEGFHLRGDLNLGPTKISYLTKYDRERDLWYDGEWSVSQVIGCLEPFLVARKFPNSYQVGIRLRYDSFVDALERRTIKRQKKPE